MELLNIVDDLTSEEKVFLISHFNHLPDKNRTEVCQNIEKFASLGTCYIFPAINEDAKSTFPILSRLYFTLVANKYATKIVYPDHLDYVESGANYLKCCPDIYKLNDWLNPDRDKVIGVELMNLYRISLIGQAGIASVVSSIEDIMEKTENYDIETYAEILQYYGEIYEFFLKLRNRDVNLGEIEPKIMTCAANTLLHYIHQLDMPFSSYEEYKPFVQYEILYKSGYMDDSEIGVMIKTNKLFTPKILLAHQIPIDVDTISENPLLIQNIRIPLNYPPLKSAPYTFKTKELPLDIQKDIIADVIDEKTGTGVKASDISFDIPEGLLTMYMSEFNKKYRVRRAKNTNGEDMYAFTTSDGVQHALFLIKDNQDKLYAFGMRENEDETKGSIIEFCKKRSVSYMFYY